ncbi:hypothetical protein GCM10009117_02930 [Gangjinia marincola]|uniref:DUF1206 domain-containing protein n=1 Tax=Gangjinia marincola TaxID=578463 RepID=A0ABN1MDH0_9FLAO
MKDSIKKTARVGYAAKGTVYAVTGVLALLTALDMGGDKAGKLKVIEFIEKQEFGSVLIAILGLGLICYAVWRFIQSISDPENIGSDGKAYAKRFGFFLSGVFYLGLGGLAVYKAFSSTSGGSGSGGSSFANSDWFEYVLIAAAIGLAIKSIFQFKKAYTQDFLKKFDYESISEAKRRKVVKNSGIMGHIARGVVTGIIAFFLYKAYSNSVNSTEKIGGTAEAFSFIQEQSYGSILLGLTAAGLICYGIYMFTLTKYRQFSD